MRASVTDHAIIQIQRVVQLIECDLVGLHDGIVAGGYAARLMGGGMGRREGEKGYGLRLHTFSLLGSYVQHIFFYLIKRMYALRFFTFFFFTNLNLFTCFLNCNL